LLWFDHTLPMTKKNRRIFFYGAVAVFVILTPILIAYSLGYTFHPSTGELERTGGIFIKSKTPRLSIFLDGTFVKVTSYLSGDALLADITPGAHHLRLEKTDFRPWSITLRVEPAMVTDLRNILLIPTAIPIATSTADELASLRTSATTGSFRTLAPYETVSVPNLPTSSLTPSFSINSKGDLIGKTSTTTLRLVPHVNSFGVIDDMVYFIDKNGFLGKLYPISKVITTIGRPGFYLSKKSATFLAAPTGSLVILDSSGGLFLSDGSTTIQPITGGVRQIEFDANGQKILLRKDQSIDIVWLQDNIFQPFQKAGTMEEVFASDALIDDADWFFDDNAHIAFRTIDGIFFTDIDPRDGKNIMRLFNRKSDELVTIPDAPRSIFFRKEKTFYTISF